MGGFGDWDIGWERSERPVLVCFGGLVLLVGLAKHGMKHEVMNRNGFGAFWSFISIILLVNKTASRRDGRSVSGQVHLD